MTPDDFWKPWEQEIGSFKEALDLVHNTFKEWSAKGRLFAWRGQTDASWPLHSSLYRRVVWTEDKLLTESNFAAFEKRVLIELHRWGLHVGDRARLSALTQLAILQHYGAPTRIIDVTFNPLIGLWFAVEEKFDNGTAKNEIDGRLFAVDVTDRIINEDKQRRDWEDAHHRPWAKFSARSDDYREWTTTVFAWRPARLDHRIAAQNGGFLIGGVPGASGNAGPVQWPKSPAKDSGCWSIDEVRAASSLALRLHKIDAKRGKQPVNPAYTIRIRASAKKEIRKHLQDLYGYRHSTIYPDYSGFALYGMPRLRSWPVPTQVVAHAEPVINPEEAVPEPQ